MDSDTRPIPWRTILAVIALVAGFGLAIEMIWLLKKIIAWLIVAAFFAVILNPVVDFLQHKGKLRRGLAASVVFLLGVAAIAAMLYAFIRPVVDQANEFADKLPTYVDDAQHGRGVVGRFVKKYKIDDYLQRNKKKFQEGLRNAGKPALRAARTLANTAVALITIMVLAFLMLMEGPEILDGMVRALSPPTETRVRQVAADCARAITGYMFGNLVISVIAGAATFVFLLIVGVPFRGVLALWVAFADLIPLVGATLGAVPVIGVAFIHSVPAGIATIVFFVAYQQFENHVLQVTIMSKTVALKPLYVLISVLAGVELFGILGALLAIPAGGIVQVIGRDLWDWHRGGPKPEPTVGTDEIPVSAIVAEDAPDGDTPAEATEPVGADVGE